MTSSTVATTKSGSLPPLPVEVWDKIWSETLNAIGSIVFVLKPLDRERKEWLRDTEVKAYGYSDVAKFGSICSSARRQMLARRQHCMRLGRTLPRKADSKLYIDFDADIFVLHSLQEHLVPITHAFQHDDKHIQFTRLVRYLVLGSACVQRVVGLHSLQKEIQGPYSSVMPLIRTFTMAIDGVTDEADAEALKKHILQPCPNNPARLFWSQKPEIDGVHMGKYEVNGVYIDVETYRGCKLLLTHMDPGFSRQLGPSLLSMGPSFPWKGFPPRVKVWKRNMDMNTWARFRWDQRGDNYEGSAARLR